MSSEALQILEENFNDQKTLWNNFVKFINQVKEWLSVPFKSIHT